MLRQNIFVLEPLTVAHIRLSKRQTHWSVSDATVSVATAKFQPQLKYQLLQLWSTPPKGKTRNIKFWGVWNCGSSLRSVTFCSEYLGRTFWKKRRYSVFMEYFNFPLFSCCKQTKLLNTEMWMLRFVLGKMSGLRQNAIKLSQTFPRISRMKILGACYNFHYSFNYMCWLRN
jgi:hypothetical protein